MAFSSVNLLNDSLKQEAEQSQFLQDFSFKTSELNE